MTEAKENLRTEYAALSEYHTSLISSRLTLLGFFLAGLGLLIGDTWPISLPKCFLGLLLTICIYIYELRTRILTQAIAKRGAEIEQNDWKFNSKIARTQPLFSLQYPKTEIPNYNIDLKLFGKIKLRNIPVLGKLRISYSVALDLLYIGLIFFFIISVGCSIFTASQSSLMPLPTATSAATAISTTSSTMSPPTLTATQTLTKTPTIILTATSTH